jgi:predicted nucleic acid-binding Zn ribbon protein
MESLDNLIEKTLKKLKLEKPAREWEAVHHWDEIVGEKIARISKPVRAENKILYVSVSSSSWCSELDFQKPKILKKIANKIGENIIHDIRFFSAALEQSWPSQ